MSLVPLLYGLSHTLALLAGVYVTYAMMTGRLLPKKLYTVADAEKIRQKYMVNKPSEEDAMNKALENSAVNASNWRAMPQAGAIGNPLRSKTHDDVLQPTVGPASPSSFQK